MIWASFLSICKVVTGQNPYCKGSKKGQKVIEPIL
jgi:hypothetical protein